MDERVREAFGELELCLANVIDGTPESARTARWREAYDELSAAMAQMYAFFEPSVMQTPYGPVLTRPSDGPYCHRDNMRTPLPGPVEPGNGGGSEGKPLLSRDDVTKATHFKVADPVTLNMPYDPPLNLGEPGWDGNGSPEVEFP